MQRLATGGLEVLYSVPPKSVTVKNCLWQLALPMITMGKPDGRSQGQTECQNSLRRQSEWPRWQVHQLAGLCARRTSHRTGCHAKPFREPRSLLAQASVAQVLRSLLWTGERDPAFRKVKEVDLFISYLARLTSMEKRQRLQLFFLSTLVAFFCR